MGKPTTHPEHNAQVEEIAALFREVVRTNAEIRAAQLEGSIFSSADLAGAEQRLRAAEARLNQIRSNPEAGAAIVEATRKSLGALWAKESAPMSTEDEKARPVHKRTSGSVERRAPPGVSASDVDTDFERALGIVLTRVQDQGQTAEFDRVWKLLQQFRDGGTGASEHPGAIIEPETMSGPAEKIAPSDVAATLVGLRSLVVSSSQAWAGLIALFGLLGTVFFGGVWLAKNMVTTADVDGVRAEIRQLGADIRVMSERIGDRVRATELEQARQQGRLENIPASGGRQRLGPAPNDPPK